jgi:hypothetical protein
MFVCKWHYIDCLIKKLGIDNWLGNPTWPPMTLRKEDIRAFVGRYNNIFVMEMRHVFSNIWVLKDWCRASPHYPILICISKATILNKIEPEDYLKKAQPKRYITKKNLRTTKQLTSSKLLTVCESKFEALNTSCAHNWVF